MHKPAHTSTPGSASCTQDIAACLPKLQQLHLSNFKGGLCYNHRRSAPSSPQSGETAAGQLGGPVDSQAFPNLQALCLEGSAGEGGRADPHLGAAGWCEGVKVEVGVCIL